MIVQNPTQAMDGGQALSARQKSRLHQVADGMLAIYNTLVRMRYLQPSWIQPGPHDVEHLLPLYQSLGLDPSIIYLYSILPYVDTAGAEEVDFLMGGEFADFRQRRDIEEARDPMHDGEDDNALRPWMTSLSHVGNHKCALIYDAKRHRIGIFGQMDYGSSDHNLYEGWTITKEVHGQQVVSQQGTAQASQEGTGDEEEGDEASDGQEEEDDDEAEEGDGEEEEEEEDDDDGSEDEDVCHWDEMDSRPAPNVLRDIVLWYENLTETPGGGEHSAGIWEPEVIRPLYRKHGWPGPGFNGDAFLVDIMRASAAASARQDAHREPAGQMAALKGGMEDEEHPRSRARREKLAAANGVNEEWAARWELFFADMVYSRAKRRIAKLESTINEEEAAPEKLLFSELKSLRAKCGWHTGKTKESQKQLEEAAAATTDGPKRINRELQLRHEWDEVQARLYEQAYLSCRADFEREFPGRLATREYVLERAALSGGFDYHARIADLTDGIEQSELEIPQFQHFIDQLPPDAHVARELAEQMLERHRSYIKLTKSQREACTAALQRLGLK